MAPPLAFWLALVAFSQSQPGEAAPEWRSSKRQQTAASCTTMLTYQFSQVDGLGPCAIANAIYAGRPGSPFLAPLGAQGQSYPALTSSTANDASCSMAAYITSGLCSLCQGVNPISWDDYKSVCPRVNLNVAALYGDGHVSQCMESPDLSQGSELIDSTGRPNVTTIEGCELGRLSGAPLSSSAMASSAATSTSRSSLPSTAQLSTSFTISTPFPTGTLITTTGNSTATRVGQPSAAPADKLLTAKALLCISVSMLLITFL